jgi:hypothetical protein
VRPFCLDYKPLDGHMIDLVVIVSSLSFVFKIGVGVSDDGVDSVVGGEIVALMRRLTNLERGWWGQIGLYFVLVG